MNSRNRRIAKLESRDAGRSACIGAADRIYDVVMKVQMPDGPLKDEVVRAMVAYREKRKGVIL